MENSCQNTSKKWQLTGQVSLPIWKNTTLPKEKKVPPKCTLRYSCGSTPWKIILNGPSKTIYEFSAKSFESEFFFQKIGQN